VLITDFAIRGQSFQCDQASEPPRQTRSRTETAQPSTADNQILSSGSRRPETL
jgi:hypothetical protein